MDIKSVLSQHNFVPSVDQARSIAALTSAILSSLAEELSAAIITPDMSINPQRTVPRVQEK